MATYKLCVEVARAYNLLPKDGQGSSIPCVELVFDGQWFRTTVKYENLNPVWNERFYFHLSDPSNFPELELGAYVYSVRQGPDTYRWVMHGRRQGAASSFLDKVRITGTSIPGTEMSRYSASSFLGKVRIAGTSFPPFSDAAMLRYQLQRHFILSPVRGELALKVYIIEEAAIRRPHGPNKIASLFPAATTMWLCVEVVRAYDLTPKDEQGSATTCVELTFDSFRYRTAVKENDLNPVWNERFYFSVSDPSILHELHLKAHVYHVNRLFKGSESLLGRIRFDGAVSFPPLHDAKVLFYPLRKSNAFSSLVKGGLTLKVYTTEIDPSTGPSNPSPPVDGSYVLESILRDKSSRPHDIPFQHLKEITDNFSHERILGQGGFGVVYKGLLHNGEMVAVKKIVSSLRPGEQKQFENEVYNLMMLKHPNIVRFVGYCYETHNACLEYDGRYVFAEMAERLLCLEYLPKGSLDKYISDESSGLDWITRYKIIEGICYGLCHLHEHIDKPIIHLDLKPANILLDESIVPKITDFGLSRLLIDKQKTIRTSTFDGTFGYMAPEFLHGGTMTPKSDIFSLGVIIMEMITGDRDYPVVTRTSSNDFIELTLKKWRHVLERSPRHGFLETDCRQIKRCIQVGLICVNPDRAKRPQITKVINMLQGLESIYYDISNEAT